MIHTSDRNNFCFSFLFELVIGFFSSLVAFTSFANVLDLNPMFPRHGLFRNSADVGVPRTSFQVRSVEPSRVAQQSGISCAWLHTHRHHLQSTSLGIYGVVFIPMHRYLHLLPNVCVIGSFCLHVMEWRIYGIDRCKQKYSNIGMLLLY